MPKPKKADSLLCVNFCAYYRPGKNEDLLCQGFAVVQGLLRAGRTVRLARPERTRVPERTAIEGLRKRVCAVCSFQAADCDYIATNGTAVPCGGFALLSHLLATGELSLDEIGTPED